MHDKQRLDPGCPSAAARAWRNLSATCWSRLRLESPTHAGRNVRSSALPSAAGGWDGNGGRVDRFGSGRLTPAVRRSGLPPIAWGFWLDLAIFPRRQGIAGRIRGGALAPALPPGGAGGARGIRGLAIHFDCGQLHEHQAGYDRLMPTAPARIRSPRLTSLLVCHPATTRLIPRSGRGGSKPGWTPPARRHRPSSPGLVGDANLELAWKTGLRVAAAGSDAEICCWTSASLFRGRRSFHRGFRLRSRRKSTPDLEETTSTSMADGFGMAENRPRCRNRCRASWRWRSGR